MIPKEIQSFIDDFSKLPAVGPRMATRLAFYLLNLDKTELSRLESALRNLNELKRCEKCFFYTGGKLCSICSNPERNPGLIAVVEKETDLLALEKTGRFKGRYLVLGELPDRGTLLSVHKLKIGSLKKRIREELGGKAEEIIIALNLNTFGDFVADVMKQELKEMAGKITRLGRGIPTGGEIEFADEETLVSALERRS